MGWEVLGDRIRKGKTIEGGKSSDRTEVVVSIQNG